MNRYIRMLTAVVLLLAGRSVNPLSAGQGGASEGAAGSEAAELAKKLQNPVADLISVPIQNNWDFGLGPEDALRFTANVQPVQFQIGGRYYADKPDDGPDWGLRFTVTLLFPK